MRLTQLQIQDFRNLRQLEFRPGSHVNLITGENASGKTSLLESIYYLSHVRSFRTQHSSDLIHREADKLQLFARIETADNNHIPLGIRRSRKSLEVRSNQKPVQRVADIAAQFPVLAIHPDSYRLITGSPAERRQYLDWGVFHVEHGFFQAWQRYRKALSQRNAALRSSQNNAYCQMWDKELNENAEHIDRLRQHYMTSLQPYFIELMQRFFANQEVRVEYRRGWSAESRLGDLLDTYLAQDRKRGFTHSGPHRADLVIQVDGQSAQTGISRGQQKALVALLRLAQAQQFSEVTNRACVLLYDDLAAELDGQFRHKILSVLADMKLQLFLTAIEPSQIDLSAWSNKKMFHVEQGLLQELV